MMSERSTLNSSLRWRLALHFATCACRALDDGEDVGWRPCPSSLCERRTHTLAHRVATSARDYRYGGFRAWLRWVFNGIPADEGD